MSQGTLHNAERPNNTMARISPDDVQGCVTLNRVLIRSNETLVLPPPSLPPSSSCLLIFCPGPLIYFLTFLFSASLFHSFINPRPCLKHLPWAEPRSL